MKLLRNLVGCLIISLVVAVGFREVDFITSSYASNFTLAKQNALYRSVKIDTMGGTWSGLIYKKNHNDGFLVLTIIHESSMKEMTESSFPYMMVTTESEERHFAEITAWDKCSEVAMIKLAENDKRYISRIRLDVSELSYGFPLFSFGHPLGETVHYSEGVVSRKNVIIKDCGTSTDGFSSTILPGSTGSGVYDNDGRLAGLVIATSAYQVYSQNQSGETISVGTIPESGMGLYIPADTINSFLTLHNFY